MEEKTFVELKEHKFSNGLNLKHVASFAIWDKNNPTDSSVIERSIDKLNGRYVFVALNFGGNKNLPEDPEKLKSLDWKNFHYTFDPSPHNGDSRIRDVLEGTRFEGAYMTDIIKNYATEQAPNAIQFISEHPEHLDWFIEEINLLSADNIEMYLFGGDVENVFKKYKTKLYSDLKTKVQLCQRIDHFSPATTRFPKWAPVQLGLKENGIGAKIKKYDPVWKNK